MASTTEIANMAISHLGLGKEIANLDTEQSKEASACRRFFEVAKEAVLLDYEWSFATKQATLNLVEEDPNDDWAYSYRYPVDCLTIRRIVSGVRNETLSARIPFKIAKDDAGKLIYTDEESAVIEYTEDITDPTYFPSQFIIALSFRLASYIAPRITQGDPFKMKQEMLAQYQLELNQAKKTDMNEEVQDLIPESESILIRG
jgi:hypothetical protein